MKIKEAISTHSSDVYLYYGGITRGGYNQLSGLVESKLNKKKSASLVLITFGGDPNAGFRIARCLRHHYESLNVIIPDICKSAGTLICVGADRLVFGDRGELGPLDIQISKPDEMFENMSGLDLIQALSALEARVLASFRNYLVDIRGGSRLRTKTAAEIATKLTQDFIAPIAAKIDPVMIGEHQRAIQIAFDYGQRLSAMSNNLKPDALEQLVSGYSSHGFVIDRKEARDLFRNVDRPDDTDQVIVEWAKRLLAKQTMPDTPLVIDLAKQFENLPDTPKQHEPEQTTHTEGAAGEPPPVAAPVPAGEGDKPTTGAPTE